ncbi:MAG: T9SS type A sorting domain-containing protein [Armatimonadetes bacterium]|nr:T9SS type A sorting domain-containing protein [Armatimonadota bacterium]
MCDWVLNLLYPNDDNDNQLIVNNYFYGSSVFAWDMHGEGHLKKNNKCEFGDNTFWIDYSPYYWQDISYYHASQPDFMPFEQWPYDPIDSESSNPARDRWIAGYHIPVLAQWNHLNLNEPSRDQYSAYFYNNIDPITGDIQKELSIVYLTYYNQSTQMEVTIEQNSDIIGDWNNKVVDLCAADHNQYIPAKRFVERIILSEVTFDDIVITIDDYDTSNKIITEPYDYSGYPPFPIFHTDDIDRDMIYATYSGAYSGGVYFGMPHVLKFRLPYNGSISINNDNDFGVSLKDGNISHSLISSYPPNNYADFNTNGTISVDMPSVDVCIGWGLNEYNISLYIDIDVNGFNIRNRVSFDGLIRMGYGYGTQSDPFFCVSEYNGGAGCPTLYSKGELENNLVSLAENQSEDAREYKLLRNRINHNDLSFTVSENQDNINYFDYTGLISVGHPENETIGVTGCGEFFSYDLQREIRIETGRDSIFVIPANDSIIISLDEYTLPQSDEVFLKLTCMKYNSRAMADKGDIDLGDTNNRDSTYVFDVVGIYENLNTSYSQLPEYLITQGYGNIIIKPSKDIEVHGISFVMDQSRNNNNLDIQSCSIISAHSLKNGSDVRSLLLFEDEDYFEFGKNGGFGVTFDSPTIIGDKIDYIFVSKGRYRNQLNEDIISNKLDFSNYPNPFNPETTISFSIHEASKIELSVYNIKGQKVKVIVNDEFEKGTHNIVWNGEDSNDKRVGSGVYFYKLKVNGKEKSVRKCLLIK